MDILGDGYKNEIYEYTWRQIYLEMDIKNGVNGYTWKWM